MVEQFTANNARKLSENCENNIIEKAVLKFWNNEVVPTVLEQAKMGYFRCTIKLPLCGGQDLREPVTVSNIRKYIAKELGFHVQYLDDYYNRIIVSWEK